MTVPLFPRLPPPAALDRFVSSIVEVRPEQARVADCRALAHMWTKSGIRPGDLVLLCLANSAELLHQYFGVLTAGAVPALLSPLTPAARLRDIAATMGARAVISRRLPSTPIGEVSRAIQSGYVVAWFDPRLEPACRPGEVVLLTSGTSGVASGCVFDVGASLLSAERHANAIGQRADDVVLVTLPLHFSYALVAQAMAALQSGSRLVIDGPPFAHASFAGTVRQHGVTVSSLTPVLVRGLLATDRPALALPRALTVGGDQLEGPLVSAVVEARNGGDVFVTYGLTQAGPRVSTLAAHHEPVHRHTSAGLPLPGVVTSLQPAGYGLQELLVTSDTVMTRTIGRVEGRRPDELRGRTIATGDAFEQDADGYLYFNGRLTDFISRRGEKINLATIRRIAAQLPDVVAAQTVSSRIDGVEEFDLDLKLQGHAPRDSGQVRSALRRLLSSSEMPREIRLHGIGAQEALPYK